MCLTFVGQGYPHENYLTLNISRFIVFKFQSQLRASVFNDDS